MLRLFFSSHSSHFAVKERRVRGNEIEREMDMERNEDDEHEVYEKDSNCWRAWLLLRTLKKLSHPLDI